MSESDSIHNPAQLRSLRDRVLDIFRAASPSNSAVEGTPGPSEHSPRKPDDRTRLLDSYDGREPACGLKGSCDHGTFSPQVEREDTPQWDGSSMQQVDGLRFGDGHHSRQRSGESGYVQGPENMRSMESSSVLSVSNRKSQYVISSMWSLGYYRFDGSLLTVSQVYIVLHPVSQLDHSISLVLAPGRFDCCDNRCIDLHSHGIVFVLEPCARASD
jgi:hypothetical protein